MISATTRPNRPVASASAKPSRRLANCEGAADGLRKRALQVVAEDGADADAGADKRDRGQAGADQFCC